MVCKESNKLIKRQLRLVSPIFFFVVDGDNRIRPDFNFEVDDFELKQDSIYVYRCVNPANGLSYGFGAVKSTIKALLQAGIQKKNTSI